MHVPKFTGIYAAIAKTKHIFLMVGFCPVVTLLAFFVPLWLLAILGFLWAVYVVWVYRNTVDLFFRLWEVGDPPQGGAPLT